MSHASEKGNQLNINALDMNALVNQWFEGVKARDAERLLSLLHSDIQLTVPFQTEAILGNVNALQTFKAFDEAVNNFATLHFEGDVNGEHLQGVDFFHFNAEGQVKKIEVMARPLAAIQYLHEAVNGLKI